MSVIVSLMGGLGFFLYGMKLMSEGLQKVAGSKMRSILEVFTKNRVIGLLVGIFFTALIQSSNATTVMVVSFVNSGLMKLAQAPGIILGANIGTTVTGQLIAFDLADICLLVQRERHGTVHEADAGYREPLALDAADVELDGGVRYVVLDARRCQQECRRRKEYA